MARGRMGWMEAGGTVREGNSVHRPGDAFWKEEWWFRLREWGGILEKGLEQPPRE